MTDRDEIVRYEIWTTLLKEEGAYDLIIISK